MSSSDEDPEFFDASPVAVETSVRPTRQGNRRKANSPSPRKVPRKKQREVLADFNVGIDDSEEEEESRKKTPRGVHHGKRKRPADASSAESTTEEEEGERRGSRNSEMENMPPPKSTVAQLADDIPEDSSQPQNNSGEGQVRSRKRLSIRSDPNASDRRSSISSASVEPLTTPSEVQTIYETCSQMFNANKINPQNAFNLRLLDCINQMINSPTYDKSNMHLTSSTVEIGTKIYVCRVENAHSQVLSLAQEVAMQQRRKKKDAAADADNPENQDGGMMEGGDDGMMDDEGGNKRQRQRRKPVRKRGRHVEEDNTKLLTGLEEQNVKFVTRRNFLKKKFNDMIYNDLEFEYFNYFLEPEDKHPLHTEEEMETMKKPMKILETYVDATNLARLEYMKFRHVSPYDPETHDIWGIPFNETEEMRDAPFTDDVNLGGNDEFAYDPANRPAEYPDDNPINDTLGEALPNFGDEDGNHDDGGGFGAVSYNDIASLDKLEDYFMKVRSLLKTGKSKYGWCGPNFVRPKSTWPVQKQGRKPRTRKEPERFEFDKINWSDKANKFNSGPAGRTVYDDKVIEGWSTKKTTVPFLGIEITSYDDDFDPLDFQNENDPKYVPTIFKLFTSRNRSILDLLKSSERRRHSTGDSAPRIPDMDDGFDHDNDIELPRDIQDDYCSQPVAEDGFPANQDIGQGDAAWPASGSIPGLLGKDDPFSLASGIDSIRFSKKPKPIDMSQLKKAIFKTLMHYLKLDEETGQPQDENESSIDLSRLMFDVLRKLDMRTEKLMSVPIFIVALMHVVADKRLFVQYSDSDPNCPVIICRGKNFKHAEHIPMPVDGYELE